MADIQKSYFLPPRWKYHIDGPIFLGSVITDPSGPQNSLNPDDKEHELHRTLDEVQLNFSTIIDGSKSLSGGISASLLASVVGVGAGVFGKANSNARYQIKATSVRTQEFYPDPTFVKAAMNGNARVQEYLANTRYKKDLYVITGLMTASGASIASDEGKGRVFTAEIAISGAAAGVPGEIGPKVSNMKQGSTTASFDATGSIVIAYQLSRISWVRRNKAFQLEPHQKGSVLADDEVATVVRDDFYGEGLGVDEEIIGAEEFGNMAAIPVEAAGRPSFTLVVPTGEEDHGIVEA